MCANLLCAPPHFGTTRKHTRDPPRRLRQFTWSDPSFFFSRPHFPPGLSSTRPLRPLPARSSRTTPKGPIHHPTRLSPILADKTGHCAPLLPDACLCSKKTEQQKQRVHHADEKSTTVSRNSTAFPPLSTQFHLYSDVLLSGKLQNAENRFIRHLERCGNNRKTFFTCVRSSLSIMDCTAGSHLSSFCPHFNPNAHALRARPAFFVICLHLFTTRP